MKEGYIQIKQREMIEGIKELREEMERIKKESQKVIEKNAQIISSCVKSAEPILKHCDKWNDYFTKIEKQTTMLVNGMVDERLNKFNKHIYKEFKEEEKSFARVLSKKMSDDLQLVLDNNNKIIHQRIENLIKILNKKMGWDITSTKVKSEDYNIFLEKLGELRNKKDGEHNNTRTTEHT